MNKSLKVEKTMNKTIVRWISLIMAFALTFGTFTLGQAESNTSTSIFTSSTGTGMWISPAEIMSLPTSGTAWDKMHTAAYGDWETADLQSDDNRHAINMLAGALTYTRTGEASLRSKVRDAIMAAKRSLDETSEWQNTNGVLAAGRQLGTYVISADLIDLKNYDPVSDSEFRSWLSMIRTTNIGTHGRWKELTYTCENAAGNWNTFACASRIAASIYLGDTADVDRSAAIIRAFFGERAFYPANAPGVSGYFEHTDGYQASWSCAGVAWTSINSLCTLSGINIDGVLVEDASRGGGCCVLQGNGISYSWEALQGLFVSTELLYRTGRYGNPYDWSNQALRRSLDFMQRSGWGISNVAKYVPWLANARYGTSYPTGSSNTGRIMGWGDWLYKSLFISGNVGMSGVTLSNTAGPSLTSTSFADGSYTFPVSYNWSGTVTPTHPCFTFNPDHRDYNNVTTNQTGQNYLASFTGTTGCANVKVNMGGANQGTYGVPARGNQRVTYGLDAGPVKVGSTNGVPIIAALRDAWLVNGSVRSFAQLMGLPQEQLSDTYYFPAYNNMTLNGQLRIGNVDSLPTTVTVTIGGVVRGTYDLNPNESVRPTYALDAGPVEVKSSGGAKIIAALRDAWLVNGHVSSFTQLMGLPREALSDTYYFPAYNNVTLSGQLRIANVDSLPTTVTVRISGVVRGTYDLNPNESVRPTYALDAGPVEVTSARGVKIIAALRDAWLVNGSVRSFAQLMGLPQEQLSDTYYFPAYNNVTLSGQLRIGNVDSIATDVTVTIGGVVQNNGQPYHLGPNQSVRPTYNLDAGPVVVQSSNGAKIIVALRDAWKVNGSVRSFVQMMGLPQEALSTTYWFPAYNNITLNGQLRFGVP